MSTVVLLVRPPGKGWGPILSMGRLVAELLEAELIEVDQSSLTVPERVAERLPRRRGDDVLLVVSPVPEHLRLAVRVPGLRRRFRTVVGWVIDCWWTQRIPASVRAGGHYDRLLVTSKEVVGEWESITGLPVGWMPLGTDALGAWGQRGPARDLERPVDLQRMGRQPEAWGEDEANAARCEARGLVYGGRPPFGGTPEESYRNVLDADAGAKTLLAFSNLVSGASYTHPTREYVTNRWLDALAVGTVVVGRRTHEEGSDELLWDGATVELSPTDAEAGTDALAEYLRGWTPATAARVQAEALGRLDWRLRAHDVARLLGVSSPTLDAELEALRLVVEEARALAGD